MRKSICIVSYLRLVIQLFGCLIVVFPMMLSAQITFKHYTTADGLPNDFTFRLYQDDQGYLWIGTDDGVAKFNGIDFKILDVKDGLRSNFVVDIERYNGDTLAISCWKGGLHFLKNDTIIKPKIPNDSLSKNMDVYIIGDEIIAKSSSMYYVYEKKDGLCFNKRTMGLRYVANDQLSMTSDVGVGYVKMAEKEVRDSLYFYHGMELTTAKKITKGIVQYRSSYKTTPVFNFLRDKVVRDFGAYQKTLFYAFVDNTRYIFNRDSIISREYYDFDNQYVYKYAEADIAEVFVTRNSKTANDHVYLHHKYYNYWEDLTERTHAKILVSDLFFDKNQRLWITSKADGLYQVDFDTNAVPQPIIEKEHVLDITLHSDNRLFFVTVNKLYEYNLETRKTTMAILDHQVKGFGADLLEGKEIPLWSFGSSSSKHFRFLDYEVFRSKKKFFHSQEIAFQYDFECLSYTPYKTTKRITICPGTGAANIVNDLTVVEDELWLATNDGVLIYDRFTGRCQRRLTWSQSNEPTGIIELQNGGDEGVWLVAKEGLFLLEKNNNLIRFTEKNGLPSSRINDVFLDSHRQLWIATQRGVALYKDQMMYTFDNKDGFPTSSITKVVEDTARNIFLAGNNGVVSVANKKPYKPMVAPEIIVEEQVDRLTLDIVDFSEKKTFLEYRINADEDWNVLATKSVRLRNYAVGDYEFQFRARNPQSNWSYSRKILITKTQVWYKKLWVTILFWILSIIGVIVFALSQIEKVKKRNKFLRKTIAQSEILEKELATVRENVAQDFHDELGNKLAGITVISEMMIKDRELQNTEAKDMAEQVRKDAKDLYFGMKDFVWAIDSKSDNLQELIVYLTDFGEELFQNKRIVFKVQKELMGGVDKLPYYWSKQLLLLFKEAMTNSLKHANATEVNLIFCQKENGLMIQFSDNGKGFLQDHLKRKNGLLNMKKRAKRIGGRLIVRSKNGTIVQFKGFLD